MKDRKTAMTMIAPSPRPKDVLPDNDKATRFVGLMTVAEYHEFDKSEASGGRRAEYEDGKVFYVPGSHHEHNRIKLALTSILFTFAEVLGGSCEAFDSDQKVRIIVVPLVKTVEGPVLRNFLSLFWGHRMDLSWRCIP